MRELDEEALDRVDVWVAARQPDGALTCAFGRWPGEFTAWIKPARVETFATRAGQYVEDLWPSRGVLDSALSLMGIDPESQLLTAAERPGLVEFSPGGRWMIRSRTG